MKKLSLVFVLMFVLALSVHASEGWEQRGDYYIRKGVNALTDEENKFVEKEVRSPESIKVYEYGEEALVCVNCPQPTDEERYGIQTFDCSNRVCSFYMGFSHNSGEILKKILDSENFKHIMILNDTWKELNKPDGIIVYNDPNDASRYLEKVNLVDIDDKDIIRYINNNVKKNYLWPKNKRNIIRVENAKVAVASGDYKRFLTKLGSSYIDLEDTDYNGKVLAVRSDEKNKVGWVWSNGLGVPVGYHHNVIPIYDGDSVEFEINVENDNEINVENDKNSAEDWLESLPESFKSDGRSRIKLCQQEFVNYYKGSDFLIQLQLTDDTDDKKFCLVSDYTLNTYLFNKDDKSNWKEFEYKCGNLAYYSIGGDINELRCHQTDPEIFSLFTKKGGVNNVQFRVKLDEYWLSIPKGSYFVSLENNYDYGDSESEQESYTITVSDLRVSQHIPKTDGPNRYKGDMISFKSPKEIKFVMPTSKDYVYTGFDESQLQFKSEDGDMVLRRVHGVDYIYEFEEPIGSHNDYVLQLGYNVNRAMIPIIGLFPSEINLKEEYVNEMLHVEANYKKHEIPLFGVNQDIDIENKNPKQHHIYIYYNEDFVRKNIEISSIENKVKVDTKKSLRDWIAKYCFNKESIEDLSDRDQDLVLVSELDIVELNSEKKFEKKEGKYYFKKTPVEIILPSYQSKYYALDHSVDYKYNKKNCPEAVKIIPSKEEVQPSKEEVQSRKNKLSRKKKLKSKSDLEYLELFLGSIFKNQFKSFSMLVNSFAKKGNTQKRLGDKPCKDLGGTCYWESETSCPDNWIKNKCLSNPSQDYLCCAPKK